MERVRVRTDLKALFDNIITDFISPKKEEILDVWVRAKD